MQINTVERKNMQRGYQIDQEMKVEERKIEKGMKEGTGSPVFLFNSPQPLPIYQGK